MSNEAMSIKEFSATQINSSMQHAWSQNNVHQLCKSSASSVSCTFTNN